MIARFFKSKPSEALPLENPSIPDNTVVYAIGDVHGRDDLLADLHAKIYADIRKKPPHWRKCLVHLGDYIDRGPRSRQVIDRLLHIPFPDVEVINLKGNHEQALLGFLRDLSFADMWLQYGGRATIHSYGVQPPADASQWTKAQHLLLAALPPAHMDFFLSLQLQWEIGDYMFVHAGVNPNFSLDQQEPEDLMWIRDEFLESDKNYGKIIVHGHTIAPEIAERSNRIGIDTGAYASGKLTCLVLEGTTRRFLQTQ